MIKKTIEYHITDSSQDCTVEEFLKARGYSWWCILRRILRD